MASLASSHLKIFLRQMGQVSCRSGGSLSSIRVSNRTFKTQSTLGVKSTPEPEENVQINSVNLDPFGIQDVASTKDTTLVQGFYNPEGDHKTHADRQARTQSAPEPPINKNRLQMYDGWIKHREQMDARARFGADGVEEAEQVRETSYGKIRLDTDNTVQKHGQFEGEKPYWMNSKDRKDRRGSTETEGASMGDGVITAEEFLKRFKNESRSGSKDTETDQPSEANHQHIQHRKQLPTVYEPIQPRRLVERVTQAEIDAQKFQSSILDGDIDSNVLPKAYQFPDFNKMTSQEVWSMLKRRVLFQNEFLLALNKPYGIPIHSPGIDCRHFIIQFLDQLAAEGKCEKVYPLHRLDKETSGVLLFAKDRKVANVIIEKWAHRAIEKTYLAVVKLCPSVREGTIKIPIGEGKVGGTEKYRMVLKPDLRKYEIKSRQGECREAITHFSVINSTEYASYLKVIPETGVKHQIRLHLGLGLGCPIIGDQKYSHRDRMAPQRLHPHLLHKLKVRQSKARLLPLHLHCNSIQFTLPEEFTKSPEPIYVHANVPYYFSHTLKVFGLSR